MVNKQNSIEMQTLPIAVMLEIKNLKIIWTACLEIDVQIYRFHR